MTPLLHQAGDFPRHVVQPAAPLGPSGLRNDAEGAAVVAAALYRDECGWSLFPHCRNVLVVLPGAEFGVADSVTAAGEADELRQVTVGVGPHDQIYLRSLSEKGGPEPLRHAADHTEHPAAPLVALQLANPADDPLLGVVAHGAGVDQHDVRVLGTFDAQVPLATRARRT